MMIKMCPMMKSECMTEKCAWYHELFEECAIFSIGDSISELFMLVDNQDRGMVVRINDD